MKSTTLAYFAGLLDGEGCIRIKRQKKYWGPKSPITSSAPQYTLMIYIANCCRTPLDEIASIFGGSVREQTSRTNRPVYRWEVGQLKAEKFLRAVRRYQRIKGPQTDNALAFRDLQRTGRQHKTKPSGLRRFPNLYRERMIQSYVYSDEFVAQCDQFYQWAKDLNQGRL